MPEHIELCSPDEPLCPAARAIIDHAANVSELRTAVRAHCRVCVVCNPRLAIRPERKVA